MNPPSFKSSTTNEILDVAIIGAGITGLSAAFYVKEMTKYDEGSISIAIFEAESRIGGKIATEKIETKHGTFLLEQGPDSFLTQKPWALELAKLLHLESEFLYTNPVRNIFVLKNGKLVKMPDGMMLMIPTRIWPFITTTLFSLKGKIRAALEFFIPASNSKTDESISSFVKRRFGNEILDLIAEPLLSGIYNANPQNQSLKATFPQFAALEEKHKSLIRGVLFAKKNKTSPFVSFKNGMQTLILALEKKLSDVISLNTFVQSVVLNEKSLFEIKLANQEIKTAKHLLVATPAFSCASLFENIFKNTANNLRKLRVVQSGCIYFAFRKSEIFHPLNGFGVVIPTCENRSINAITWVSSKLSFRAPKETVLLRVFFGGSRNPWMMQKSDEEITAISSLELEKILKIKAKPIFIKIYRDNHENPQYDVGHLDLIDSIQESLPSNCFVAGSSYLGVGIPDCVHQGFNIAQTIVQTALRKSK